MTKQYFFYLKRRFGNLPSTRIGYSVAHNERERAIVLKAYKKSQDPKNWELIEEVREVQDGK